MTGIFSRMKEQKFWKDWEIRFKLNHPNYINPDNLAVVSAAESLQISESDSNKVITDTLWDFVRDNHGYNLTKRWREPEETLKEGVGDCEDYVFLIASLLPHFGINRYNIVAGEAFFNGGSEFHVWMKVDGKIVDPTAPRDKVPNIEYEPELEFTVNVE